MLKFIKLLLFLASLNIGTVIFFVIDYGPRSCFFTSDLLAGVIGGQWWVCAPSPSHHSPSHLFSLGVFWEATL